MRTICIIQARLSSSRLPAKVLTDIGGKPMLDRVLDRVRRANTLDKVVVATSTDPSDDRLADHCRRAGIPHHRGPLQDVLGRFVTAARHERADVVVRVTADCPLIDPVLIDAVVALRARRGADYASNVMARRFPRGLDIEAFTAAALFRADREGREPHHREHVTPYIYEDPHRFALASLVGQEDQGRHRWTVDTPEDLSLARALYERLASPSAGWRDVLALIEREPALSAINAHVEQKAIRAA